MIDFKRAPSWKYEGEDERTYFLEGGGSRLKIPKNRSLPTTPESSLDRTLYWAFRLLAAAGVGWAPVGLGTLVFAPLAVLLTVGIWFSRWLSRPDRIRAGLVLGISAALLGIAVPLSMQFMHKLRPEWMLPLASRLLVQAAIWLVISMAATIAAGTRLRRSDAWISTGWLVLVVALGDIWPLLRYGLPVEVLIMSIIALALGLCICLWWFRNLNAVGQVSWMSVLLATPLFLLYVFFLILSAHPQPVSFLIGMVFFLIQTAAAILALSVTYENLDITCRVTWRHSFEPLQEAPGYAPMVSLHLPCFDEPPVVVAETLRALARLDYPNYEVVVVDNNTPLEQTWRPIEKMCRELGPCFRFVHVEGWPGYKAGALNFALAMTDPAAELVGVIDSDYLVVPTFLKEMVPAFADPQVAFVQAPQDYRDYRHGDISEAIYYNYQYFFRVPMNVRNEHNAIIFAGTMGLMRKSVLQEIGGWDEACITEDAEASLRVLERGYKGVYHSDSLGRGLMPCSFESLKRQRYRWSFGNVQILRKHWEELMPWAHWVGPGNKLSGAQRYFYLLGGLQWFSDAFNFLFVLFLILGGLIQLYSFNFSIIPVTGLLMSMAFIFTLLNLWRMSWVLNRAMSLSWVLAIRSMYGMFSVGWVVAWASLRALFESKAAFLRTPKVRIHFPVLKALSTTEWEAGMGVVCLAIAASDLILAPRAAASLFIGIFLLWQSTLFLAAPIYSLLYKSCTD